MIDNILKKDELFTVWNRERIWKKYCGFLALSLDEFMVIQRLLLMEQVEMAVNSELGRKIMGEQAPKTVEDFRQVVPFTTYEDYEPYLSDKNEDVLPEKPAIWAHTSGRTGLLKWAPYTVDRAGRLADDTLAAFVLSSATREGEVHLHEGVRVVLNLPPVPYVTGLMGLVAGQRMPYRAIPPLEEAAKMEFEERIRQGFRIALNSGIDYAASIAVVLAKVGEGFGQMGRNTKFSFSVLLHPLALFRVSKAMLKSKLLKRPMLPRDIWHVKGLVCGGTDTAIYRDEINYYWGVQPLDVYVSTETGFIAMQSWTKKGMTFIPYSNFYEFIPEDEWLKSREDPDYQPSTVLLDEVEEGRTYEIVITNFHGGAFLRYRIGDLIKIIALKDKETGVNLPQMVFQSRADDVIDIAGFARLDEKTVWQAVQNTGYPYVDWSARKEYEQEKPVLHLYLELSRDSVDKDELRRSIDQQLIALDSGYADLRRMTGAEPLVVTLLERGSFQRYLELKRAAGFDLAHLKPPHMNPPDHILDELLHLS
ncbi:MAG: GH3 auxin-responsive promoter family protein [Chloroflexi bacterium]|nr:GH3 auxin-responsive promoter family protein [Chloroflexota bacterium]